ncbi:MAG: polysaccharide biosynthesis/export family protein [Elusimicrobia bacterium]|nr:polysaccharide biosynthesis/export family protein [Elusimicrobiota bacterium]
MTTKFHRAASLALAASFAANSAFSASVAWGQNAAGAGAKEPSPPPAASPSAPEGAKIRISPGDVVSITVFPVEEYSREVTVQPDGKIELALIGAILVKGLSSRELQDLLQQRYAKYVANPQVTVNVRRFAGRRVAIIGQIRSAGYYEYRDGMRLLELVSQAGGLSEFAQASKITVLREGAPSGAVSVNFKAVLAGRLDRDLALQPGDTVYIPKQRLAVSASWLTTNVLPWATLASLVATLVLVSKQ